MMNKLMDFLGLGSDQYSERNSEQKRNGHDEWDESENDEIEATRPSRAKSANNIVHLQSIKNNMKITLMEPSAYNETQDMADHLRNRRVMIVNLQRLEHEQAKRVIDFLSGTVYAIGGDIHKLGSNIFLCIADNVEIQGAIEDTADHDTDSRMR